MRRFLGPVLMGIVISGCQSKLETEAREAVNLSMKDPASSKFSNITVYQKTGVVCGEVNSKNSFGAYSGIKTFIFSDGRVAFEGEPDYVAQMSKCSGIDDATLKRSAGEIDRLNRSLREQNDRAIR